MIQPSRFSPSWRLVLPALIILHVASITAWLVNLEVATMNASGRDPHLISRLLPEAAYAVLSMYAVDMSTISTFLPMLLSSFLLLGTIRRARGLDLPWWVDDTYPPFPGRFPSFCVWAGLVGTLYGLVIGLPSQATGGSPIVIQDALGDLILGFKTAVFSTIIGMASAGTAIAISAYCRRFVFTPNEPESLATTLDALRGEFANLKSHVADMSDAAQQCTGRLEAVAGQLQNVQNTVRINWFRNVLDELVAARFVQGELLTKLSELIAFLNDAQKSGAKSLVARAKSDAERHEALATKIGELQEILDEQLSLSRGFHNGFSAFGQRITSGSNGSSHVGEST